ncbi:MAG: hypothetical protein WC824_11825 [Bacteroidota bacterium]|jgi:hypothetical protein
MEGRPISIKEAREIAFEAMRKSEEGRKEAVERQAREDGFMERNIPELAERLYDIYIGTRLALELAIDDLCDFETKPSDRKTLSWDKLDEIEQRIWMAVAEEAIKEN